MSRAMPDEIRCRTEQRIETDATFAPALCASLTVASVLPPSTTMISGVFPGPVPCRTLWAGTDVLLTWAPLAGTQQVAAV